MNLQFSVRITVHIIGHQFKFWLDRASLCVELFSESALASPKVQNKCTFSTIRVLTF